MKARTRIQMGRQPTLEGTAPTVSPNGSLSTASTQSVCCVKAKPMPVSARRRDSQPSVSGPRLSVGITHVIRGDDHISNTPKQVAIYEAFGWAVPKFAHLSTILGADRERLSKRHGATSISTFREMGYLPEALVNYLALLGWGAEDGKTETFTLAELTRAFSLERVTPSPAIFDFDKLNWLNRHYLKQADPARLASLAWPYFAERLGHLDAASKDRLGPWFARLLALIVPKVD